MQLMCEKAENYLLVKAEGRLDASWSEYFLEELRKYVREGEHQLIIDAAKLVYLSSAGIRSLLILHKELLSVQGAFRMINAYGMVRETLICSGFEQWLTSEVPVGSLIRVSAPAPASIQTSVQAPMQAPPQRTRDETYTLGLGTGMRMTCVSAWVPWNVVHTKKCRLLRCSERDYCFGIGCAARDYDQAREHFGEFLAVGGHVIAQPPSERARPDYMLSEKDFVPTLLCLQAIHGSGEMSHLLRFQPTEAHPVWGMGLLVDTLLHLVEGKAIVFVIMGEIEGMVGVSLIRSPGTLVEVRRSLFREYGIGCGFEVNGVFPGSKHLLWVSQPPLLLLLIRWCCLLCPHVLILLFISMELFFPISPFPTGVSI